MLISQQPAKTEDEISSIAKLVTEGYEDDQLLATFVELAVQLWVAFQSWPRWHC